jgi:hypothetical protein
MLGGNKLKKEEYIMPNLSYGSITITDLTDIG